MKVLNKDYNSVSGSNQVQNLNPHPPIGMDTLDENEVDIGEVQVGLCDNMIGTNSAIWESYESYHSKDDTFTWESVEMYNELFDIPEQRDASTKDCKGKGKVDYSSSSRKLKTKGSGWSEESSTSEELDVGQIFFCKRDLSMSLSVLAMEKKFQFVVKKSTKEVLFVRCIDNKRGWRLRAVRLKDSNIFKIKKYVKVHSCSLEFLNRDHRQAKSWVVGELIKSKFKGPGRIYKPRDIIEDMRQDYGINMSYEKAWRARENAYEQVRGSPEESYNFLRRYGEALKFTNPGFLNFIRPVIVMDGTFLKNKYRGQLIVAVCLNGNNQIYHLAFGVVDRETDDSIQWFLEKLKGAIREVPNLDFVTDRKTCFSKEAWRHLLAFPNGSEKYLNDVGIARWSRVHCPGRRYNMMTTNIAESMNSILKEPRDLSIASFLENVRALLQRWFSERREEDIKVTSTLTKWEELVIQKKQEGALTMKVNPIDCYQFHVKDLDKEEVVNLQTKECTCKEFQAEQLPCSHAIVAAWDRNINVYSLCANYYTNECLLVAYAKAIYPVRNQSDWKTSEDYVHMTVLPPKVVKRVGRPKKKRIPSVGEASKLHKMAVPSDKYFPATVSCQVHKIGSLIKDKLTKEQLQMFDKTIFGPLLNVNMVFNGQLIHHFLLRQIPEDGNADGICFSVLGKNNFEFTNDDDAVKIALAVFIETVMVGKDKKTQFDMDILGRVDDEEAFKSFDWSTFFYTRLLNSLKTSLQGKKEAYELKKTTSSKAVSYYNIKGYVLAFQVWAYEVLSTANEQLATRNSKGLIPRILRWNCTQASSYKMLQKNIFNNKNTVVQPKLKMSTQEKAFMES
ncbi:MuDRA-like transposase [Cucumis melo var. makuwa]|uniref:MuDRA-like transposase n=1 Tax=Cucumis melo var. makuwa TaxID=1194695 RepID=A0A5A7V5G9_CUCMM|nr:MuDRA-like transposase [Cucumis melo var. makuwa]